MPWTPSDAKKKYKKLTKKQAEVWSKVANASLEGGDDDATAIKKANAAVNRMRHQEAMIEGAATLVEAGRMISSANMKTLKSAMASMKAAMEVIMPLMDDDAEESTNPTLTTNKWELVKLDEASKILAQSDSYDSVRYAVQCALRKRALSDALTQRVNDGSIGSSYDEYYYYDCMPYIRDMYDDFVVYTFDGQLYQCEYEVTSNEVTLGEPTPVQVSYVPTTVDSSNMEAETQAQTQTVDLDGDLVVLEEKAVREDGTARVKIISPGWGSSGYYSSKMLERDGPKVFTKGMHMYMNHPTDEDDRSRPERDLRDLVGAIASDVVWEKASPNNTGDGLYADVKVFDHYRSFIDEAAPYIGTSIRAAGTAIEGEAEGHHGLLVDSLKTGYSVDYVTVPGRGGQILPLFESARSKVKSTTLKELTEKSVQEVKQDGVVTVDITQEEFDKLKESAGRADKLSEQMTSAQAALKNMHDRFVVSEARNTINETLATIEMPSVVRTKVATVCARSIPLTEAGELDSDKLVEAVKAAATEELQYIESVTGNVTGGKVVGMPQPKPQEINAEEVEKAAVSAWTAFGLSADEAKVAANGRFN